jgi:hypothetical protein
MKTSSIRGYYWKYEDALAAVSERRILSRQFSIQRSSEAKYHPWILIYYGKFA